MPAAELRAGWHEEKRLLLANKRTLILALLLLVLGTPPPGGGQTISHEEVPRAEPTRDTYAQLPISEESRTTLREAVQSRDYARAEALLAGELARQPGSQALLTTAAAVFFLDGKYLNCAVTLKKAEVIAPLTSRDRFTLALSYIILNHGDWARPELEKLADADPHNPSYPYWLGRIDYDAMQYKAAKAHLQAALKLDPRFMKAYDNLGLTFEALGQYDDAIRVYQQAILMNRSAPAPSPWPPLNLGTLLVKLGNLNDAEVYLGESLKYAPRFSRAHYQMGVLQEKQKQDDAALLELAEAARDDPTYPEPHYLLARIYARNGQKARAEAEQQAFAKLKQESPQGRPP